MEQRILQAEETIATCQTAVDDPAIACNAAALQERSETLDVLAAVVRLYCCDGGAFLAEHPELTIENITVVVDATFGHRISPKEKRWYEEAISSGGMITPPAGAKVTEGPTTGTGRPDKPTVVEFVEYFALLKEMPAAQVPAAVATAVERVDLSGKARAKLRTLSGGMLRRVGIAQAIVNEPELLLLDEPTAGLDPEQRVNFRALLRELGQRATVVVSTHLVEDVGAACSQVALMDQGKVVFDGTPGELTARGTEHGTGDAPLERGYTAVLAAARA